MPRTKSAKKQMRQSRHRAAQNRTQRSQLRTALKKVRAAGTQAEATEAYTEAAQLLDRAGRKNLIHRNAAARQKRGLATPPTAKTSGGDKLGKSDSGRRSSIGGPSRFWRRSRGARSLQPKPFHHRTLQHTPYSKLHLSQSAANSAPQRSQYHSVGRFSVPHSPHFNVFA